MTSVRYSPKFLVAVSGGSVYMGNSPGNLTLVTNGEDALEDSPLIDMEPGPGSPHDDEELSRLHFHMYFVDGERYRKLDVHTGELRTWEAFNGPDRFNDQTLRGLIPAATDISLPILDHASGQPIVQSDQTANFPDGEEVQIINAGVGIDGSYTIVSTTFDFGTLTTTIELDPNPGLTDPVDPSALISHVIGRATLLALYRDRMVIAGFVTEPTTWYMSAVGDPMNWDFGPEIPSSTQAQAAPLTEAGRTGDRITALIPFSDDLLVFGCEFSLWALRGDPAAGGAVDAISRNLGIVGNEAWTFDDQGNLYAMSFQGLIRLDPVAAGQPQIVGRGVLDRVLSSLNYNNLRCMLEYDSDRKQIFVLFVDDDAETPDPDADPPVPDNEPVGYIYDVSTDGWWPIQFPFNTRPTSLIAYEHPDPSIRAVIFGGRDGYLRAFNDSKLTDESGPPDGGEATETSETPIESFFAFAPLRPFGEGVTWKILESSYLFGEGSADAVIRVYSAPTVEQVLDATTPKVVLQPSFTRSRTFRQTVAGETLLIEVFHDAEDSTWVYESGNIVGVPVTRNRRIKP